MSIRILNSITAIAAERWNALELEDNPFVRHEFLAALEEEGCATARSGWAPAHLLLENNGVLEGAVPLYLKEHSWGEFVFDFSWANAYSRAGLRYYPKLVAAVPFTPASGPRLLTRRDGNAPAIRRQLLDALVELARERNLSSVHVLFATATERAALAEEHFLLRTDCQFHWRNHNYASFEDFLKTFRADKRKKAHRERRRVAEAGIHFRTLSGHEIDAKLWDVLFAFSSATFHAHGHEHYLTAGFFKRVARALPDAVMVKLAMYQQQPIATAIFFRGGDRLYGRYWGAAANFHSLHFETCYYQGIEYCIEQQLAHFEPGTQGEHKVPRGFEPTMTTSAHWIAHRRFARAIEEFVAQEARGVEQYMSQVREHGPFRRDLPTSDLELPGDG
jgi:predicted N-acyltransferase